MEMENIFYKLDIPTKIYYGRGILEEAIRDISKITSILEGNIMLVTTGGSLIKLGHIGRLKEYLLQANPKSPVYVYDSVSANPTLDEVEQGARIARQNNIDVVVGFGGGSSLDAAKAIAVGAASDEILTDIFRSGAEPLAALPVVAIPTTSGTGSEVSKAAILNDEKECRKGGIRGKNLFPMYVSPTLPKSVFHKNTSQCLLTLNNLQYTIWTFHIKP